MGFLMARLPRKQASRLALSNLGCGLPWCAYAIVLMAKIITRKMLARFKPV
jgi:hypothetical protein